MKQKSERRFKSEAGPLKNEAEVQGAGRFVKEQLSEGGGGGECETLGKCD